MINGMELVNDMNEGFPHFAVLTEFVLNDVYYENI